MPQAHNFCFFNISLSLAFRYIIYYRMRYEFFLHQTFKHHLSAPQFSTNDAIFMTSVRLILQQYKIKEEVIHQHWELIMVSLKSAPSGALISFWISTKNFDCTTFEKNESFILQLRDIITRTHTTDIVALSTPNDLTVSWFVFCERWEKHFSRENPRIT